MLNEKHLICIESCEPTLTGLPDFGRTVTLKISRSGYDAKIHDNIYDIFFEQIIFKCYDYYFGNN